MIFLLENDQNKINEQEMGDFDDIDKDKKSQKSLANDIKENFQK